MTDQPRRGGKITFLLAFAAFVMSGIALWQQNRNSAFIRGLSERVSEFRESFKKPDALEDVRRSLSEAMNDLLLDEDKEAARDDLVDIQDRLENYLEYLRGSEDADSDLVREVESLRDRGSAALEDLDAGRDVADEVREMFQQVKALDRSSE